MSCYYRYYDSPDGQDFFKKEYFLLRKAYPLGIYLAWFDVMGFTRPTGLLPVATRFIQVFSRPLIAVSMWNVTTFMASRYRGEDKPSNYVIGLLPVSWYMSRYFPPATIWPASIPLMLVLAAMKQMKMWYPNYVFFKESSTYRDDMDNSLFADYLSYLSLSIKEKNWVTIDDAIERGLVSSTDDARAKRLTNYKDGSARGLIRVGDGSENIGYIA